MAGLKVNSAVRRIVEEKDSGIVSGTDSMLALLRELQTQTRAQVAQAAAGSWDSYHLTKYLDQIEKAIADFQASSKSEAGTLLGQAWSQDTVTAALDAAGQIHAGFHISTSALDVVKDFTFHKIENLSNEAWTNIKGEIQLGILGGKTPQEVAKAIGDNLTDPGIFRSIALRAETITQTEMGRVFSIANQERLVSASGLVPGLEKQWWHAGHPKKARPSHLAANGQHVPVSEPFQIGLVKMMYPRDPAAPLDEVIHCGCDHIPYHAAWND